MFFSHDTFFIFLLINIPNTAAISFMQNLSGTVLRVFDFMIIDFGAKCLQASVFHMEAQKRLQYLSHASTHEISGDEIDDILLKHFEPFVREAWQKKQDPLQNSLISDGGQNKFYQSTIQNLRNTVHQLKTQTNTSTGLSGTVTLVPFDEDIEVKMTLAEFESLVHKNLEQWVQSTLETAINKASEKFGNLNLQYVRRTGGSSLLPLF